MTVSVTDDCGTSTGDLDLRVTGACENGKEPGWVTDEDAYEHDLCVSWGGSGGTWYYTYVGSKRYGMQVWILSNVYGYACPATPYYDYCTKCLEAEFVAYKDSKYTAVEEGIGPIGCRANSDQNYPPTHSVCLLARLSDDYQAQFMDVDVSNWECRNC